MIDPHALDLATVEGVTHDLDTDSYYVTYNTGQTEPINGAAYLVLLDRIARYRETWHSTPRVVAVLTDRERTILHNILLYAGHPNFRPRLAGHEILTWKLAQEAGYYLSVENGTLMKGDPYMLTTLHEAFKQLPLETTWQSHSNMQIRTGERWVALTPDQAEVQFSNNRPGQAVIYRAGGGVLFAQRQAATNG